MHRVDHQLLAKELNAKVFHHGISEDLLLQALTAPSLGVGYDYEQLELIGLQSFITSKPKIT
jgi:endoribonuclease Dicer